MSIGRMNPLVERVLTQGRMNADEANEIEKSMGRYVSKDERAAYQTLQNAVDSGKVVLDNTKMPSPGESRMDFVGEIVLGSTYGVLLDVANKMPSQLGEKVGVTAAVLAMIAGAATLPVTLLGAAILMLRD